MRKKCYAYVRSAGGRQPKEPERLKCRNAAIPEKASSGCARHSLLCYNGLDAG